MDRRSFLKTATTSGALAAAGLLGQPDDARSQGGSQPNILFILVDELRYPRVFPRGINDVGAFLSQYMPNTYALWRRGVKFAGHYTAGVARLYRALLQDVLPNELRAPLPSAYARAQMIAKRLYIAYGDAINFLALVQLSLSIGDV